MPAPTYGPNYAGTGANEDLGGTFPAWSNPSNATGATDDGAYAACTFDDTHSGTDNLVLSNFSFSIDSGDTIDGLMAEMEVDRVGVAPGNGEAFWRKHGSGTEYTPTPGTAAFTTTEQFYTFGSSSNLAGTTWTPANINGNTFALVLRVGPPGGGTATINVDRARVTITTTASAPTLKVRTLMGIGLCFVASLLGLTRIAAWARSLTRIRKTYTSWGTVGPLSP